MEGSAGVKPGRRERRRVAIRESLSEKALQLFLQRGYDSVTVAEIAEAADVALTTLFAHFPDGKQALVFGGSGDRSVELAEAIESRPTSLDVLGAVERFMADRGPSAGRDQSMVAVLELVRQTPELQRYARQRWIDCQPILAVALIAEGSCATPFAARALARLVLELPQIVGQEPDARIALDDLFARLRSGWVIAPPRPASKS